MNEKPDPTAPTYRRPVLSSDATYTAPSELAFDDDQSDGYERPFLDAFRLDPGFGSFGPIGQVETLRDDTFQPVGIGGREELDAGRLPRMAEAQDQVCLTDRAEQRFPTIRELPFGQVVPIEEEQFERVEQRLACHMRTLGPRPLAPKADCSPENDDLPSS